MLLPSSSPGILLIFPIRWGPTAREKKKKKKLERVVLLSELLLHFGCTSVCYSQLSDLHYRQPSALFLPPMVSSLKAILPSAPRTAPEKNYLVGQNVHSDFSVCCCRKTPMNFLVNPIVVEEMILYWEFLKEWEKLVSYVALTLYGSSL